MKEKNKDDCVPHFDLKVEEMYMMFNLAESFNQPLDKWDVSNVKDMSYMFVGTNLKSLPEWVK